MEYQWTEEQKQNIDYFNSHVDEWVQNPGYNMKFVVIANKQSQGFYNTFSDALKYAVEHFDTGHFIIQEVTTDVHYCFDGTGRSNMRLTKHEYAQIAQNRLDIILIPFWVPFYLFS